MKTILCLLLVIYAGVSIADEPDMSVFGVQIGKPLSLPECVAPTRCGINEDCITRPSVTAGKLCYTNQDLKDRESGAAILLAVFPDNQAPDLGGTRYAFTLLSIGGIVEAIRVTTNGAKVQQSVLDTLQKKYGKPHHLGRQVEKNLVGAQFDSIVAEWAWPNKLFVTFHGIEERIDNGNIFVYSPRYLTERDTKAKRSKF